MLYEVITLGGNWAWRMESAHFDSQKAAWLRDTSRMYARNLSGTTTA